MSKRERDTLSSLNDPMLQAKEFTFKGYKFISQQPIHC